MIVFASSFARAQVDDNSSFSGSDSGSGGGFDFGSTSDSGGGGVLGGGGIQLGSDSSTSSVGSPFSLGSVLESLTQSTTDSGYSTSSARGPIFSSPSISMPNWSLSVINPEVNPVAGFFANVPATHEPWIPTQSYMAMLSSRSPLALFVDLNGNGVRGDYFDGLLFNLFFPSSVSDEKYEVATARRGVRSSVSEMKRNESVERSIKSGLTTARIALTSELFDGRRAASLEELAEIIYGTKRDTYSWHDRDIALASILNLATLNPVLSTAGGPILAKVPQFLRENSGTLSNSLWMRGIKAEDYTRKLVYTKGGNQLAVEVNLSRLATVMTLVEERLTESSQKLNDDVVDNMRAALYFTAFEIKRLKLSNSERDAIIKGIVSLLAEATPKALRAAALRATDAVALKRLEESLIRTAPVINQGGYSKTARISVSVLSAAAAVGLWMAGGDWAMEMLTNDVALQVAGQAGATATAPVFAGLTARWLVSPSRLDPHSAQVKKTFASICEQALATKK
jgi:hypothetical protein